MLTRTHLFTTVYAFKFREAVTFVPWRGAVLHKASAVTLAQTGVVFTWVVKLTVLTEELIRTVTLVAVMLLICTVPIITDGLIVAFIDVRPTVIPRGT